MITLFKITSLTLRGRGEGECHGLGLMLRKNEEKPTKR